ncbi:MAG: PAS domain S-box protein [Bacteroidota bacterium]
MVPAALPPEAAAWLLALAQRALAGESWPPLLAAANEACREHLGWSTLALLRSRPDGQFEPVSESVEEPAGSPLSRAASLDLRRAVTEGVPVALEADTVAALATVMHGLPDAAALAASAGQPARPVSEPGGSEAPAGTRASSSDVFVALRSGPFAEAAPALLQAIADLLGIALRQREDAHRLQRSEAQSRAILEATVDGIITIDDRGCILTMNPAAERIFGYATEEIAGCNVKVLMPPPYREEHDGYMNAYRETGRRRIIGIGREVSGRRKDGSTFPMELSVSEVRTPDGMHTFTGLVRDISARRELEAEVLRIADEERRRIGQDLHDGLGQMLTGTHLIARGLARQLEAGGSAQAADATELASLIKDADGYARALARGLVPVELEAHGLAAALKRLAANAERLFGITCTFDFVGSRAGDIGEAPEVPAAAHLFRIAQEAVSNAVQHGRAAHVAITLAIGTDQVRLRVDDDGVGIGETLRSGGADQPRTETAGRRVEQNRGMGVRIMHYRARIAQGALEIRPGTTSGTTVLCTIPVRGA